MDLSTLVFRVETAQLKNAVDLVDKLGQAVNSLNNDVQSLAAADKNAAAAALLNAKARRENALAAKEEAKASQAAANATTSKAKAEETVEKVTRRSSEATKQNVDILQRQKDIFEFMTQGFSKGQSSILATAKASGQLTEELKGVLNSMRVLQGGDPFDKSLGAVTRISNEYRELKDELRMVGARVELTSQQYRELTRAKLGIIAAAKETGASFSQVRERIRSLNAEYIKQAEAVNRMTAVEKANDTAVKNKAKTLSWVQNEFARAENALEGLNNELNISTSNRILKFENQLKQSGLAIQDQIAMLEKYKATLKETDATRRSQKTTQGRAEGDRQVDLLARSLAPQISDVAVSLAGGMNPFTVLMQQGLQVRDLMQLSGVEADRMGEAFRKAGAGMITTSVAAGKAIGSMLVGSLVDAGNAVTNLFIKTITLGQLERPIEVYARAMSIAATNAKGLEGILLRIGAGALRLVPIFAGIGAASVVGGIIALGVALKQIIQQENELNRVITMNGAALGVTYDGAYTLAKAYGEVNGKTTEAITVMQEMAKAGNLTSGSFTMIADASIAMSKATGVSIAEVVKKFSDLAKEPTKVLTEIAIQTGYIDAETLKLVRSLEASGDKAAAAAIALKAYGDASKESADTVRQNYGYLTKFAIGAKEIFASMWDALLGIGRTGTLSEQVSKAQEAFDAAAKRYKANSDDLFTRQQYESAEAELLNLKKKLDAEKKLGEQRAINSSLAGIDSRLGQYELKNRTEYQKKTDQLINDERELLALKAKGVNVDDRLLIVQREKARLEKEYLDSLSKGNKEKTTRVGGRVSTPKDDTLSFYESALKTFTSNAEKAEQAQENLTVSQKKFIEMTNDPRWEALSAVRRMEIRNAFAAAQASEVYQKALEEENKKRADAVRLRNEQVGQFFKELEQMQSQLRASQEEGTMLEYEASLVGLVSEERQKLIAIKRIQLELDKEIANINASSLTNEQKSAKIDVANATAQQKIANINTKIANDLNQKMVDGVTDAIMTGLIEGGEAGKKKLRDLIVAELQKPIRIFVQAIVSDIFGGGGAGGQGGGIGNTITQSVVGKAVASYLGTALGTGTTFAGLSSAFGTGMQAGFTGTNLSAAVEVYNAAGMSGYANALQFGQYAAPVAGVVGGVMAGRAISGGYSAGGNSGNRSVNAGTAIGFAFGGPLGALIGGAIGGVVNRAFGRKLVEQGIQAKIDQGNVDEVMNYTFEKGGWFRSDKTKTTATDQGTVSQVTKDVEQIKMQALGVAGALGLNSEAVRNFSGELKINLKGVKSAEEASQKYSEGMQKLYVDMLKATGGLDQFRRSGETVEMALQRMTQEAANLAQQAGFSSEQLGTMIRDGMLGRIAGDELGGMIGDYLLDSIYNALAQGFAEQITGTITNMIISPLMTAVITGGNLAQVVNATTIAAVRKQATDTINAFKALLSDPAIQAMFNDIANMSKDLGRMISSASTSVIRKTSSMVRPAVKVLDTAAEDLKRTWQGIVDSMIDEVKRLRGEIIGDDSRSLAYYQAQFATKTAQARSGNQAAAEALPELSQTIEELIKLNAASGYEVRLQQAQLMTSLSQTASILSSRFGVSLPAFDVGTNYVPKDMIAQVHEGEMIVPKAFNPAAGGSFGSNAALEQKVQMLIEEMKGLRIEVRADVSANSKTARILERVTPDGESLNTTVVT